MVMIVYYTYWIIFNEVYEEYNPILKYGNLNKLREDNYGTMHLFDKKLETIIPAIEYVLHLPRLELDLYDLDEETIDAAYDESHNIIPIPDSIFVKLGGNVARERPTLIIYADNCDPGVKIVSGDMNPMLGCYKISELNENLLKRQWHELWNLSNQENLKKIDNIDKQYLLKGEYTKALPLLFLGRQYNQTDQLLQKVYNSSCIERTCIELQRGQITHQNTLMEIHKKGIHEITKAEKIYESVYKEELQKRDMNVVITFPGVSKQQIKYGGLTPSIPEFEKRAIRLLGLHRSIAKNGVLIELPCAKEQIYRKINEIEMRCKNGTNNKYIWKALMELGKILGSYFTDYQLQCIMKAKHLTIFSDLPIGLTIIENTEVPLQCYKEISYRPLSPLTREFQLEMGKCKQHYLGKGCKIAFAECIIPNAENRYVRKMSEMIFQVLSDMKEQYPNMLFEYGETYTVKDIKKFINDNFDADILYISAHGYYAQERNMAGLMIGNEFWMADENDLHVPPVVLLSACHVSPRGSGAVNVADLFIRAGAITVLGTFIPVNAKRNMILMTRLFTYILEGQKESSQYKTLADAWAGVVSTNAIHELLQTSEKFEKWMYGKNSKGKVRMIEFQLERCVGRLHPSTIYSDTINILKEMLKEEEMEGKFGDILEQKNFFPESFFYQFIGYPENVFLYNEIFSEFLDK